MESGLTWNNAPIIGGAPLDSVAAVARNKWVEWDVTATIIGNGVYSFGLHNANRNAVHYVGAEGARPPGLVIGWGP